MPALFRRAAQGKYEKYNSIYSTVFGESAYLLEDELNEMQANLLERSSLVANALMPSGILCDYTVSTNVAYDSTFYVDTTKEAFTFMLMGLPLLIGHNSVTSQPAGLNSLDNRIIVKLSPPPVSGTRTDLVILETWYESRSYSQGITKFGGETSPSVSDYEILDARINSETSRRFQWRWRIRTISGENSMANVHAFDYLGVDTNLKYTANGNNWMVSTGKVISQGLDYITNGNIVAIPLFTVNRRSNDTKVVNADVIDIVPKTSIYDNALPNTVARTSNVYSRTEADATFIKGGSGGGGATIGGDLTITGNLTVTGTSTTVNTQDLYVADNIITINSDKLTGTPTENAGIEIKRGNLATVTFRWNETSKAWEITSDGTNYYKLATAGTLGIGSNVDTDMLDGQHGSYYTNPVNITQSSSFRFVSDTEKTTWNAKQNAITGAASSITVTNLGGNLAVITDPSGKISQGSVTATELSYLSGVTSSVQTQLNNKQATISGAASTVALSNLTANKSVVSDASGKLIVGGANATEVGYLSGVTSAVQTQLNTKLQNDGSIALNNNNFLKFKNSTGVAYPAIGMDASDRIIFGSSNFSLYLSAINNQSLYALIGSNAYKIFHEGLMGASSGLDADKVDGKHLLELWASLAGTRNGDLGFTPSIPGGNVGITFASVPKPQDNGSVTVQSGGSVTVPLTYQAVYVKITGSPDTIIYDASVGTDRYTLNGTTHFFSADGGYVNATGFKFWTSWSAGYSATWVTNSNVGVEDTASIRYYDTNRTYAFWGTGNDNSALVISSGGDARNINSDVVALKSTAAVIADAPEFRVMNGAAAYVSIQPTTSFAQYLTDRSFNYFNKDVKVTGQLYAGPSNDQIVWNAGNDGTGSGLDADLLGGVSSANYMKNTSTIRAGTTKLYRNDSDADFSVQTFWDGSRWRLYGYTGASQHAGVRVDYADNAGSASSATTATTAGNSTQLNGLNASSYMRTDANTYTTGQASIGGNYVGTNNSALVVHRTGDFWHTTIGDMAAGVLRIGGNTNNGAALQAFNQSTNAFRDLYIQRDGGKVGIATSTPAYTLDVNGDLITSNWLRVRGNAGLYFESWGGGWTMTDNTWIRAYSGKNIYTTGTMQADTGINWGGTLQGTSAAVMNKTSSADGINYTIVSSDAKVYRAVYNDLAELFLKSEDTEPGDIVVVENEKVRKVTKAYDKRVVGVHSDTYGMCLGGENKENPSDNYDLYTPVGISGRVFVKLTGDIEEGDFVVASDIPGVGMKANQYAPGTVIGKSMQTVVGKDGVYRAWVLIMNI